MNELGEQPEMSEKERIYSTLKGFEVSTETEDLYWSVMPEIALKLFDGTNRRTRSLPYLRAQSLKRSFCVSTGPRITKIGPVFAISTSVQHDRVLNPVVRSLSGVFGKPEKLFFPRLGVKSYQKAIGESLELAAMIRSDESLSLILETKNVKEMLQQSSILIERARQLLCSMNGPAVVLVATQHGAAIRSVLAALQPMNEVSSIYIPHAPVARNHFYHDLPFHYAILRGPAEVSVYQNIGVSRDRLVSVGDPSVSGIDGERSPVGEGVLYAMSSDNTKTIREEIEILRESKAKSVEVSPHPRFRDRKSFERILPSTWTWNPLPSTYERIRTSGFLALFQRSSGIGLEALKLGLPVIDFCNPGELPNYYYLSEPGVERVTSSAELNAVLDSVSRTQEADRRRQLIALRWMQDAGENVGRRVSEHIVQALEAGRPESLIFDGWKGPSGQGVPSVS